MTRKIKFRGKSAGEWHYGHLFAYRNTGGCIGAHFIVMQETEDANPKPIQVMPETVGQFTGLYDKNGQEIYEGDIVKEIGLGIVGYILFLRQSTGFRIVFSKSDMALGNRGISETFLEVIGNVTDNPELLKGGEGGKRYVY